MKKMFLVGFLAIPLLSSGCVAHAHNLSPAPAPIVSVSLGWVWTAGHWSHGHYTGGHWAHPHHGKSYRTHNQGPPPKVHKNKPHSHKHHR